MDPARRVPNAVIPLFSHQDHTDRQCVRRTISPTAAAGATGNSMAQAAISATTTDRKCRGRTTTILTTTATTAPTTTDTAAPTTTATTAITTTAIPTGTALTTTPITTITLSTSDSGRTRNGVDNTTLLSVAGLLCWPGQHGRERLPVRHYPYEESPAFVKMRKEGDL